MYGGAGGWTSPAIGTGSIPPEPAVNLRPSQMDRAAFLRAFGDLYEHSPWVAARVFDAGLDARHDVPGFLHEAFRQAVLGAGRVAQMELLRAHPQLAVRSEPLSEASRGEQAGAGLGQCSPDEAKEFAALNAEYLRRFSFPFIVAVRGLTRAQILGRFRERVKRDQRAEFSEALEQVCLIGKHRLAERLHG